MSCSETGAAAAGDFHYDLPPELIAQEPAPRRGDARLLLVDRSRGLRGELVFRRLAEALRPGDLLVLNDSRVLPARLLCRRAESGGRVEILLVRPEAGGGGSGLPAEEWLALARPARRLREGVRLAVLDAADGEEAGVLVVAARRPDGLVIVRGEVEDPLALAERLGAPPLPPYVQRAPDDPRRAERMSADRERYQTVYARETGSVAAPTAGLHFEPAILADLAARGIGTARVTLHVGPGTFRPPTPAQVAGRRLHREIFHYEATTDRVLRETRARGGRVVAVGTTSLRVLETVRRLRLDETAANGGDASRRELGGEDGVPPFRGEAVRTQDGWSVRGETRLFLRPPDEIRGADGLLTNFHLPGSSLLMLVAAFTSERIWREAYAHAVAARLRFYSYGDAMLIMPGD